MSWSVLLVVGLAAAPVVDDPAVLRGRVTGEGGKPLAEVLVRVAVPATDMRFVDTSTEHRQFEAKTDAQGFYRVEIPGVAEGTKVSIDAMTPGYRRLVGTLMSGGDAREVAVGAGKESEADMTLEPARYVGGTVIDDKGRPIAGVKIGAYLSFDNGTGGIDMTASRPDGSFGIFGYPLDARERFAKDAKGRVHFTHPDYIEDRFEDVYTLDPDALKDLRIILDSGHRLAGTVVDEAGRPVAGATVKVTPQDGGQTKGVVTDPQGRFAIRGLKDGVATLKARALGIKQKALLFPAIRADKDDLDVRLAKIPMPADIPTWDVLGLKLADATPEWQSAYDLYNVRGALILDPGRDSARLKVGDLAEGYLFWMVGDTKVGSVREFVNQILAETAGKVAETYSVRVVYEFSTTDMEGNNTQYFELKKADLDQLKAVADRLKAR